MKIHKLSKQTLLIAILGIVFVSKAEVPVNYNATAIGTISNDEFAPYYMSSLNHGIITQSDNSLLRLKAWKPIDKSTRFSYGFGVDVVSGYSSGVEYQRFDSCAGGPAGAQNRRDCKGNCRARRCEVCDDRRSVFQW